MNKHVPLDQSSSRCERAIRAASGIHDDRRVCVLATAYPGRMIDVWQDEGGLYRLHCPTPGCNATPRDWFYHGTTRLFPMRASKARAPMLSLGLAIPQLRKAVS